MSDAKATQQEPSMEEILASIRRIISEDSDAGKQPPAQPGAAEPPPKASPPAPAADVLELTEMVEEDGSVVNLRNAAKPKAVAPEPVPEPEPEPPPPPEPAPAEPNPGLTMPSEDALLSAATAAAATSALSALRSSPRETEPRSQPLAMGSAITLEDLVRQELKPILKDWLDQNLQGIVERLVDREIKRLSRQADAD